MPRRTAIGSLSVKSHGLANSPRPTITPLRPGNASVIAPICSDDTTSPLYTIGCLQPSKKRPNASLSGMPLYCCLPNLGCSTTCFKGISLTTGSRRMLSSADSCPMRIFTENTTSLRRCISSAISLMCASCCNSPLPLPAFTCMGKGQPMFKSILSQPSPCTASHNRANSSRSRAITCGTVGTPALR